MNDCSMNAFTMEILKLHIMSVCTINIVGKRKNNLVSRCLCMDVAYIWVWACKAVSATDMMAEGAESLWT